MATLQFKNNASTTLSGSINDTQTSITVLSGSSFPVLAAGDYFYATMYEVSGAVEINMEIVKVTGTSGNIWTIVRGQDGTTARSRNGVTTCNIELRLTAASAVLMLQRDRDLADLASAATARTNLGLGTLATQNASAVAITGGTISGVTLDALDSTTTVVDNLDGNKKLAFQLSGITTGNTRTLTIPDASGTIALVSDLTTGYQPLNAHLTSIAAFSANGILARSAAGVVSLRSITQPGAGITVTNGDGASGNPTLALADDLAAVEALSSTGFVRRTAANTWSASAIADGDLPTALTGKTYNALTLTAAATGFSVAGGTTSKTLTVSNSITLAGTDATTITLPATSGTVALNNQTMYLGTTAVNINRGTGALSLAGVSIDGSAGSATSATSATKSTNLVGGNTTTLLGALPYQSAVDTTTLLSPNVTATKQFLAQTGTGTNGAAPVWSSVSKSDVGLGSVENTALSTWTGATTITTLGTIATGTWNATAIGVTKGGTGAATAAAGFNALSPVTTLGDLIYGDAANSNARLAGNITSTKKFLRQTGNGTTSAAPAWDTLVDGDIPTALTSKTYNGLTLTAAGTGFAVAGGATSKTLTVSNTLTLAGTDSSTLNIGGGGTLGSAAYTSASSYISSVGASTIVTLGTVTTGTWQASTIGLSYGGTGATTKAGAYNALSPMSTLGDIGYHDGTNGVRLAGNTAASKRFLTQTGTGTVSAAPGWNAIADGDLPTALTGKTYNALTLTSAATGFTVAGGTTSKTLTVGNTLTLSGTDGSTLNVGGGGTLGTAAFTASTAYSPVAGSSSITTVGTVTSGTWNGTAIAIANGGTGQTSKASAYNALTPITTLGDLTYGDAANSAARLAGNITTTKQFLSQTGTGTVSAAPAWSALAKADVGLGNVENTALSTWAGSANITTLGTIATGTWNATAIADGKIATALTGKTYNGLSLTAAATGFTVAGGTTSKTLTVSNTLTLSGTDASTLNIGGGGTLGTAAFTASTAYSPVAGSTSLTTLGTIGSGTWQGGTIGLSYGGTGAVDAAGARTNLGLAIGTNVQAYDADLAAIAALAGTSGILKKTAADTWSLDTSAYITGNQSITLSGDASGTGATAITVTLANSGVTAGTYKSVTVNAKGLVTAGTNPTTLAGYGITDAQALDADLTAIAGLAGTTGLLKKTAANTWSLDTSTYLTGNQSITLSGDASGTGATAITVTLANVATAGTYKSVTINAKGLVTSGTNPTTLAGYGITDAVSTASPTFTGTTTTPNLAFNTASGRITGDFSNATLASRVLFQSSTAAASTSIGVIPNATGSGSNFTSYGAADPNNSHTLALITSSVANTLSSSITGTGVYKPLTLATGGSNRMTLGTSGGITASTALYETKTALAANDIDLLAGNLFTKTITAITTLTVSNVPATGTAVSFILNLTNGGAFSITWWAGVKWAGGTVPTLTAAGRDVLGFFTHDGGTTWTGLVLGKDVK